MRINTNRWNRIRYTMYAPIYDYVARPINVRGRARAKELLNVREGERVLIDGCGTGLDLEWLPRNCHVTAIDITPAVVERTRKRAAALGMNVDARVMDAAHLDFPDESFDCIVLHLILAAVPDPYAAAREAERVLRRGGRASIYDKFVDDPPWWWRAVNVLANFIATDITRSLSDILKVTNLRVVHNEPSILNGILRVVICTR